MSVSRFAAGTLQDARLFGDGYDFQISVESDYFLREIKGVRGASGAIRFTNNEFEKASEFGDKFCLAVISSLEAAPRINVFFDPLSALKFTKQSLTSEQIYYAVPARRW